MMGSVSSHMSMGLLSHLTGSALRAKPVLPAQEVARQLSTMLGAKLSISSSAPFRTVKQCPLPPKYGSPPSRGLCPFNLALSSSVMGGHVEDCSLFMRGRYLDRLPHFVTCLSTEHRIKGLRKNQESLTLKLGNLIFR